MVKEVRGCWGTEIILLLLLALSERHYSSWSLKLMGLAILKIYELLGVVSLVSTAVIVFSELSHSDSCSVKG